MLILKSRQFSDEDLLNFAEERSTEKGGRKEKLLHWDFGPLMTMSYDREARNYLFSDEAVPFHWDGAFFREPKELLFYCTDSEGEGGETLFVNTEKLWEDLSSEERKLCLNVRLTYRTRKLAHYGGEIDVPLVQTHPVSGKTILRMAEKVETELNPVELTISGVGNAEEFYFEMVNKLYDPRYLYEHKWEKGDLVICDNFTYLHGRRKLGANRIRTFKRIQIL